MSASRPGNDNSGDTAVRLAAIEGLLSQVLEELREKRRRGHKRARSASERTYDAIANDPNFKPTELQVAAAKRALARIRSKR